MGTKTPRLASEHIVLLTIFPFSVLPSVQAKKMSVLMSDKGHYGACQQCKHFRTDAIQKTVFNSEVLFSKLFKSMVT